MQLQACEALNVELELEQAFHMYTIAKNALAQESQQKPMSVQAKRTAAADGAGTQPAQRRPSFSLARPGQRRTHML